MSNKKYDLIIFGGGTSGVSCAWNAAKKGLKVLIVEKNSFLGGAITSSLVVPAMKTSKNAINTDFFNALYKKLNSINGAITYCDGNQGWFNPELTKIALDVLMNEVGVDILFEHSAKDFIVKKNKILSVYIDSIDTDKITLDYNKMLFNPIETKYIVDATGDAKICKKLNCEFLDDSSEKNQPTNLRFIMSGINIKEFSNWLLKYDTNREITTACTIDNKTYLSTAYTWDSNTNWALKPLFKKAIEENVLKEKDTNYFQMFSIAGTPDSIGFNCPRLLNKDDKHTDLLIQGRLTILRLSEFCKKYFPGFRDAYISSIANSLGIRVSNRVKGKYIYTYKDLISGKTFTNPVLISDYPIDIHSDKKDKSVLKQVYQEYQLPLESLEVQGFDNLYVIGRCISAEFEAQAALRIIPSCFSMGEGLAKHL